MGTSNSTQGTDPLYLRFLDLYDMGCKLGDGVKFLQCDLNVTTGSTQLSYPIFLLLGIWKSLKLST